MTLHFCGKGVKELKNGKKSLELKTTFFLEISAQQSVFDRNFELGIEKIWVFRFDYNDRIQQNVRRCFSKVITDPNRKQIIM